MVAKPAAKPVAQPTNRITTHVLYKWTGTHLLPVLVPVDIVNTITHKNETTGIVLIDSNIADRTRVLEAVAKTQNTDGDKFTWVEMAPVPMNYPALR